MAIVSNVDSANAGVPLRRRVTAPDLTSWLQARRTHGFGPSGRPRSTSQARRLGRFLTPYLYIAPFFALFIAFGLFPLVYTAWVALHDWDPLGEQTFIGLDNFRRLLFDDWRFWNATTNTVSIWLLSTVPQLMLALGLAQLLNARFLRAKTVLRMALLVPNVTSVVAVAIVFSSIFGRDFGLANWLLGVFGFERIDWRVNRLASHLAISSMVAWRWTGYNTLIYLAAMQAIPNQIYEAATIDGASAWRRFIHITVPQLRNTIIFTVIISTIGGMQIFAEPLVFGGGGAGAVSGGTSRQFQTLTLMFYEQGISRARFGYGSAVAWMLFVIVAGLSVINYLIIRRISSDT